MEATEESLSGAVMQRHLCFKNITWTAVRGPSCWRGAGMNPQKARRQAHRPLLLRSQHALRPPLSKGALCLHPRVPVWRQRGLLPLPQPPPAQGARARLSPSHALQPPRFSAHSLPTTALGGSG